MMDAGPIGARGTASPGTSGAAVTLPTWMRALPSALVAEANGDPTKLGITYDRCCGGLEVSRLTLGEVTLVEFAGGLWAITVPASFPGADTAASSPTCNPRRRMLIAAARSLCPTTSGGDTRIGPRLSATRTRHPRRTCAPASGVCETIFPAGMFGL